MDALALARMNLVQLDSAARFPRGYVRHEWTLNEDNALTDGTPIPADSSPMVADYFDALRCLPAGGVDIDAAIGAAIGDYLYPIDSAPLCPAPRPEAPLTLTLSGPDKLVRGEVVQVTIERARPDAIPLDLTIDLPAGVTLAGKASERIVDTKNAVIVRELHLKVRDAAKQGVDVSRAGDPRTRARRDGAIR